MAILITGGTGMVGSYAARELVARGERPILYDVAPQLRNLHGIEDDVTLHTGDVTSVPEVLETVRRHNVDRIIHTAGILTSPSRDRPHFTFQLNLGGTACVLEVARLVGVRRVVFCSSATVYDFSVPSTGPIGEEHPARPVTVYAATKLAAEHLGNAYAAMYGIEFVALRLARLWAPGYSFPAGTGGGLFYDLITRALLEGASAVTRDDRPAQEYVYVRDAALGAVGACLAQRPAHPAFNIAMGDLLSFDDIVGAVQRRLPDARIDVAPPDPAIAKAYAPRGQPSDLSRARAELGFEPRYHLAEAMEDHIEWVQRHLLPASAPIQRRAR